MQVESMTDKSDRSKWVSEPPVSDQWAKPVELRLSLLHGTPRPKASQPLGSSRKRLLFWLVWGIFSLTFMMAGIGFYLREHQRYAHLMRDGQAVAGVVIDKETDKDEDSINYYIEYSFDAPLNGVDGPYVERTHVSSNIYETLTVGQQVDVVYLAKNPKISRLQADLSPPDLLFPLFIGGIGMIFILIGGTFFLKAAGDLNELGRLERRGLLTEGLVFDLWSETDSEGDSTYMVAYAYQIPTPRGYKCITRAEINTNAYQKLELGDRPRVKYLPNDPETSILVDYR